MISICHCEEDSLPDEAIPSQQETAGMEKKMDELKWELLVEVQGRLEADLLQSYLEAYGVQTEIFQESVGYNAFPVTIDGLGRVQIFVSKEQLDEARKLLADYNNPEGTK